MDVRKLAEYGYDQALFGAALSYRNTLDDPYEWWTLERKLKFESTAAVLAPKDGGHNKFLESMVVWLYIRAPRYWWSEFDTYRVGMTKNSGSTMHTALKRPFVQEDFIVPIPVTFLSELNLARANKDLVRVKQLLPESYLQERQVCTNYKTLKNIIEQRHNHRLLEWSYFVQQLEEQLDHWELINGNIRP